MLPLNHKKDHKLFRTTYILCSIKFCNYKINHFVNKMFFLSFFSFWKCRAPTVPCNCCAMKKAVRFFACFFFLWPDIVICEFLLVPVLSFPVCVTKTDHLIHKSFLFFVVFVNVEKSFYLHFLIFAWSFYWSFLFDNTYKRILLQAAVVKNRQTY